MNTGWLGTLVAAKSYPTRQPGSMNTFKINLIMGINLFIF